MPKALEVVLVTTLLDRVLVAIVLVALEDLILFFIKLEAFVFLFPDCLMMQTITIMPKTIIAIAEMLMIPPVIRATGKKERMGL